MKNICTIAILFMTLSPATLAWAEGGKKGCQPDLWSTSLDPEEVAIAEEGDGYSNSFEGNRTRLEGGPDEVEDRQPIDHDALNPDGFPGP